MNRSAPQQIAQDAYMFTLGRTAAASNVYLVGSASSWLLVDTGWGTSARRIWSRNYLLPATGNLWAPRRHQDCTR